MLRSITVLAVLLSPSLALSGPKSKPPPASQHNPPIVLDEPVAHVRLISQGDDGYRVAGHVELVGVTSATDMARIDWKQKGKVLASAKCQLSYEAEHKWAYGDCTYDKPIKAKGAIDAELIYWDDQEEKEYLVRTFKVKVHSWKGLGTTWQIVPDDVLATAWMFMGNAETNDGTYRQPALFFWLASDDPLANAVLRCVVDGKTKLPDFKVSPQGGSELVEIEADHIPKKGNRQTYEWQNTKLLIDVFWGKRDTLKWDMPTTTPAGKVMADNPGQWDCKLRQDGKAIRQFLFTVDKDGMVAQDEMQSGKGAIPTVNDRVVLIDVRLTKDSASFDTRINPAALKKSMNFGLPWPDHPKVKTIHASYPPKSGLPDPK